MLELEHPIEASSSKPINDLLASLSHKRLKVMTQFMEWRSNRSTTVEEKSEKAELEDYLHEPCICYNDDSLKWWCKIGSNIYQRISVLAK